MDAMTTQARALGLAGCAPLIRKMQLPPAAPLDAALSAPVSTDPSVALQQMFRRGLDPDLIDVLWKWFEKRPLERGLLAWDVLAGSLLPINDQPRLQRFREAARLAADVLEPGKPFVNTSKVSTRALVERVALPHFQELGDEDALQITRFNGLGALEVNVAVSEPGDPDLAEALRAAAEFARILNLAHLPTLASFYLDYLWRRAGQRARLADYIEVLCDANARHAIPRRDETLIDGTADEMELVGYMLGRLSAQGAHLMANDFRTAPNAIDYKAKPAADLAKTFQRSHLVHAELLLDDNEFPVPFEVVQEVIKLNPAWRYAARVRLALLARLARPDSAEPLKVLDNFVDVFGNERWAWDHAYRYAPTEATWTPGLRARMAREVATLPHDCAAWQAIGRVELLSDDGQEWMSEIDKRIVEQCRL